MCHVAVFTKRIITIDVDYIFLFPLVNINDGIKNIGAGFNLGL